jgi:ferric-dicitrate binding protein FerR (iron transport regulator)
MVDPSSERRVEVFVALTEHEFGIVSQEQLDRGWQRIEEPLVGRRFTHRQVSRRSPVGRTWRMTWRMWMAGFATASAVSALALLAIRALPARTESALRYVIEGPAASQGNAIASPSGSASRLHFSDQSRIDLGPSTNMIVEGLDARGARIGLVDGALDVYVKPRGNASWRFMAGPFRINVKGTAFHLAFSADRGRLTLQMKSGLVEVIAPPNRTIAVGRDESLELYAQPAQAEAPSLAAPSAPSPVVPVQVEPTAASAGRNAPVVPRGSGSTESARHRVAMPTSEPASIPWSKLLAKGDFADVIADAERRGIGNTIAGANPSDLSALADAARYTKRYDLARQVLLAMRSRFAGADHARDASFFLGRLAEALPDRSETALGWYETYLREAPRGLYASEALGREMALLAPSAPERARKVAGQYLARFPHGPQSELARSLLEAE